MTVKVFIVDDEQPAREELAFMLGEISGVELIGEASTGMEAIKKVKEMKPELLFLDIQLPDLTGLQVAELMNELDFPIKIVFLTAYDHFAIDAFKLRAFHYLLKPYDTDDLMEVFHIFSQSMKEPLITNDRSKNKLAIDTREGFIYLSPTDIFFVEKEGREVILHTKTGKINAMFTLSELYEKLEPFSFFRTHKSYLVNLEHVRELRAWFSGSYNLIINDQEQSQVPVSRNYVKDLRDRIEL